MNFLRRLKKKDLYGKICLLRTDFNVQSISDSLRLEHSLPTIKFLLKNGARIILLSHRGRPAIRGERIGDRERLSLRTTIPFLENELKKKIVFLEKIPFKIPAGKIFLLENIRFWHGEEANELDFAEKLAVLGDFYVNDAFAVSHRENASVAQLPKLLPAYAGLLLEEEVKNLSKVMLKPKKPLVLIFGGAKLQDKLPAIENLLPKASTILLGSTAVGFETPILKSPKVYRPTDWVSENKKILDIGPLTAAEYAKVIAKAKTIIWNGPLGLFENKKFASGSAAVAKAIIKSKAFSVAGGGETTQLVLSLGWEKKFSFLSTGGGAMLEFLAGKELPGIKALQYNK